MFRTLAITLLAAASLLPFTSGLDIPTSVFSVKDLKGADTRKITDMYVFGDSYSDDCNGARFWVRDYVQKIFPFPVCPPAPIGRADYGEAWPEIVRRYRPDWNISIYAVSAATCDKNVNNQGSVDISGQLKLFGSRWNTQFIPRGVTTDPATTVATLLVGGNDLALIQAKAWGTLPSYATSNGDIDQNAGCIKTKLDQMHSVGFRRFVLFELPPINYGELLGDTPDHAASTAKLIARRNALTKQYAQDLVRQWNDGSTISIFPSVKLFTPMVTLHPSFGFKIGKGKYCGSICSNPFDYAWADHLHVSYRAFYLMANAFVRFLDPNFIKGPIFSDVE
ncbi:hypothetical protein V8E36_003246 [Tilletia maclaganii]